MQNNFEKGIAALFLSVLVTAVSLAIGASIFFVTFSNTAISRNMVRSSQAAVAAEAGVEDAAIKLKAGQIFSSSYSFPVGSSEASVSITSEGELRTVEVQGDKQGSIRKVETVLKLSTIAAQFHYGMQVGDFGFVMDNNSTVLGSVYSNYSGTGVETTIAQQLTTTTNTLLVGDVSSSIDGAQSFTSLANSRVRKARVSIKRIGNPGPITLRVLPDNSGVPSTSGEIAFSTLSGISAQYAWIETVMTSNTDIVDGRVVEREVISGQKYWLVVDTDTADASNYYQLQGVLDSVYALNTFLYSENHTAGPWTGPPQGARDIAFRVTGGTLITGDVWIAGGSDPNQQQTSQVYELKVRDTGSTLDAAQSFVPDFSARIHKVSLYLRKQGNPGNATIRITIDAGDKPHTSSFILNTLVNSNVTSTFQWVDVSLGNPGLVLIPGQKYWIVFDNGSISTDNYYVWGGAESGSYAAGRFVYCANFGSCPGGWQEPIDGPRDAAFKAFVNTRMERVMTGADAHASTILLSSIGGDAYYSTIDTSTLVEGTKYPNNGAPPIVPLPITDSQVQFFKDAALAGGVCAPPVCDTDGDYERSAPGQQGDQGGGVYYLGPMKVPGIMRITGTAKLVVTGTIHVVGSVTLKEGGSCVPLPCEVSVDPSFGTASGVIVTDGFVSVSNDRRIIGSGAEGSYLMIVSTSSATPTTPVGGLNYAMVVENETTGSIYYALNGAINMRNKAGMKEAAGKQIEIENTATVTYETGLANVSFSMGPEGSFEVVSWKEVE